MGKNPKPIPYKVELMLKRKGLWGTPPPLRDPDDKPFPGDDVYLTREHTWKRWDLGEALEELRLLNHPSFSWSKPGPRIIEAKVEIDMRASKKDKFIEEFSRPVPIMHSFDRGIPDRNVLCSLPPRSRQQKQWRRVPSRRATQISFQKSAKAGLMWLTLIILWHTMTWRVKWAH